MRTNAINNLRAFFAPFMALVAVIVAQAVAFAQTTPPTVDYDSLATATKTSN